MRRESRFKTFAPRAIEAGLAAAFTFPLHDGDERLGALDLYRDTPGPLTAASMKAAQTLADVAAAYLLNAQARDDLRDASDRSRESALHDALTGLPNRVLLVERIDHAVQRARRSKATAAVLFVDLDRFKLVNDEHGHGVGDALLIAVAERLGGALRSGDTLARMSGDEFVILCEDLDSSAHVEEIASRIDAAISAAFVLPEVSLTISASIGIAFVGRGDQLSEELLRDADTAMYQAKRKGGARHQLVDLREQHLADERANLERDLRGAAFRGELRSEYQPIVETSDGRITGAEALIRWEHPTRGLVSPTVLVPLAERSGLITEIGKWVLEQACTERGRWPKQHMGDLTVAVNVSAHQLMAPGYADTVATALSSTVTDPKLITLEVTESVFVQDSERALVVLGELKRIGVSLALDDFGTGYSSLTYLHRFPIDSVKVDQSFVANLGHDAATETIVESVIDLAHKLGMSAVAEGVETVEQYEQLASLGCDFCQGYYFARPLSVVDFDTLVEAQVPSRTIHLPRSPALSAPDPLDIAI
jgi:diguanylate cyclase (GGDEF)-like protein